MEAPIISATRLPGRSTCPGGSQYRRDVVIVSGYVSGNIKAIERLELHAPGRIEGRVYTSDFSVKEGALFQGECIMIRHLSERDKKMLRLEGFYDIHYKDFENSSA